MPRPQKNRKIHNPPKMKGFKPFGIEEFDEEPIVLNFEEFEAIRLVCYDNLQQEEAASMMEVSRPTLTRIYNKALKKIAKAFIEGKIIAIEGGNYKFDKEWFKCKRCHKIIEGIENHEKCDGCNFFGKDELIPLKELKVFKKEK